MKKYGKKFLAAVAGVGTALVGAISAFADETTTSAVDTVVSQAGTQMGSVFNGAVSMITTALPYIFGLVAAGLIVSIAIKWVKKMRGN